jgi:predicted GNAT family acetyltransferase
MHPLDNVIWQALTTRHAVFAESSGLARRFVPEVSPLAGLREPTAESYEALRELVQAQEMVGLFLHAPYEDRPGWNLIDRDPLLQMVWENGREARTRDCAEEFVELNATHSAEMIALAELTKPGPFNRRTHEMGTYLGIFREGKLVAMAGERLKVPGFTEVSAVCTHPEYLGKGYARILMTEVMRRIVERGETPFLHVRENNLRAIELYRRLGFSERKRGHFAMLRKESVERD